MFYRVTQTINDHQQGQGNTCLNQIALPIFTRPLRILKRGYGPNYPDCEVRLLSSFLCGCLHGELPDHYRWSRHNPVPFG